MADEVFNAALAWFHAGAAVLPAASDGSKRPGLREWKVYQQERPGLNELATWFKDGHAGMGVVCGAVSGGLEMVEFEAKAMDEGAYEAVAQACMGVGLGDVWLTITTGYAEESPSGGRHFYYRIGDSEVPGNTKIARRAATDEELVDNPDDRIKTLIETRGQGGWVVTAPSNGTTHPSGRPWTVVTGEPATIPTITRAQREHIIRVMRSSCDEYLFDPAGTTIPPRSLDHTGVRPGDEFEARTTWAEILEPHGWRVVGRTGRTTNWCRPGKGGMSTSATTGNAVDRDRLYVFSSSTVFEPERPYNKFGAYALLNFNGDFSAAAAALRSQGLGDSLPSQAELISSLLPGVVLPQPKVATVSESPAGLPANPTEADVADLLVRVHGDKLRYSPGLGWHVWDGKVWARQDQMTGQMWRFVDEVCRMVPNPRGVLKWGSAATMSAVESIARRDVRIVVSPSTWDPDAHLLNTPAGVVDLHTGLISAHNPMLLCSRITTYGPDPDSPAPKFLPVVAETFLADEALMVYVQRVLGCALFGHNKEQIIALCHGDTGNNGKTLLIVAVANILGTYALKAQSDWFMVRRNGAHPSETVSLDGPRLVYTSEVASASDFDEQRLKELSGNEPINARYLYSAQTHVFIPRLTLFMLVNNRPTVRRGGNAFFRRVREIPFLHTLADADRDLTLPSLFEGPEYGPFILSWLIEGARAYHQHGLVIPERVRTATAEYANESGGAVGLFLEQRCRIGGGEAVRIAKAELHAAYLRWCRNEGIEPLSKIMLTKALRPSGITDGRDAAARYYANVMLYAEEGDE